MVTFVFLSVVGLESSMVSELLWIETLAAFLGGLGVYCISLVVLYILYVVQF